MDRRNLGSELKSTTLYGREFQIFMMRSLKNAALKRESLSGLFNMGTLKMQDWKKQDWN